MQIIAAPSSQRLEAGLLSVACLATVCIGSIGQVADSYQNLRRSLLAEGNLTGIAYAEVPAGY